MKKNIKGLIIAAASLLVIFTGCKRDEYYTDGGLAQADYPATMMGYLEQKPVPFDTIAQIVKLAGLEDMFKNEDFTFFAPDDDVIKRTIGTYKVRGGDFSQVNQRLYEEGRDTIKQLSDVDSVVWKKFLMRYMFKGINRLKDYPQVDLSLLGQYPGQLYYSLGGDFCNIGVEYGSANNVKYIGARRLKYAYIENITNTNIAGYFHNISSSDIKPTNGIVHTLEPDGSLFGFNSNEFYNDILATGLKSSEGN